MAAILKTFAGLNFYTRTCFIDYYHISFKKSHQTLRPRSCRVNQNFDISWILDLGLFMLSLYSLICVGPGRNPNCWFSHAQAQMALVCMLAVAKTYMLGSAMLPVD